MENALTIRCQSCGAGLKADGSSGGPGGAVSCNYCGASFIIPDPETDPVVYKKTFQAGYDVEQNRELAEAIQWVKKQRGGFMLSDFGTSLDFMFFHINDRGCTYVGKLYNLENLNLHMSKIHGKGLAALSGLTKLKKLDLSHTPVKDKDLKHLEPMQALEYLNLDMCDLTDACIPHLEQLPALEHLNIDSTDISDAGILRLAKLPNIRKLEIDSFVPKVLPLFRAGIAEKCVDLNDVSINFSNVTDDDLEYLKPYDSIRTLDLRSNKITGEGLKYLLGFKRLMTLYLSMNPVSDEAVPYLAALPRLRVLEAEYTLFTEEGLARLKEKKPRLQIKYKKSER